MRWSTVDGRRRIGEREGGLLDLLVCRGEAPFVLTQVFFPGWDAEHLDETIRSLGVTV
jgi:hypothetical protein